MFHKSNKSKKIMCSVRPEAALYLQLHHAVCKYTDVGF